MVLRPEVHEVEALTPADVAATQLLLADSDNTTPEVVEHMVSDINKEIDRIGEMLFDLPAELVEKHVGSTGVLLATAPVLMHNAILSDAERLARIQSPRRSVMATDEAEEAQLWHPAVNRARMARVAERTALSPGHEVITKGHMAIRDWKLTPSPHVDAAVRRRKHNDIPVGMIVYLQGSDSQRFGFFGSERSSIQKSKLDALSEAIAEHTDGELDVRFASRNTLLAAVGAHVLTKPEDGTWADLLRSEQAVATRDSATVVSLEFAPGRTSHDFSEHYRFTMIGQRVVRNGGVDVFVPLENGDEVPISAGSLQTFEGAKAKGFPQFIEGTGVRLPVDPTATPNDARFSGLALVAQLTSAPQRSA